MKLGMKLVGGTSADSSGGHGVGSDQCRLDGPRPPMRARLPLTASLEDFKTVASVQQQLGQVHTSVYKTVALIGSLDDAKVKAFRGRSRETARRYQAGGPGAR